MKVELLKEWWSLSELGSKVWGSFSVGSLEITRSFIGHHCHKAHHSPNRSRYPNYTSKGIAILPENATESTAITNTQSKATNRHKNEISA
jgi:hypothetical protein